jgi:hypothetical protein
MQRLNLVFVIAFGIILAACSSKQATVTKTEIPRFPTAILELTATSIAKITEPTEFIDNVEIQAPGYGSSLLSPIKLDLEAPPITNLRIELVTEAGALLSRLLIRDPQSQISLSIPFEVDKPTPAFLIASTEDDYGRLIMLDSVRLQLLSAGENEIAPFLYDFDIQIYSPLADATIEGGTLTVVGEAFTNPGRALTIHLVRRDGHVIATGETYPVFGQSVIGNYSLTLIYDIEEPTWVLIAVHERQNGFNITYASVEVLLNP